MKNYTFIEVCAGGGGLSTGLCKAGFTPLLLNDNDKNCCETLRLNHPDINISHEPMENLYLSEYIGKVDLFTGGIPCQAWSHAGLRKGLDNPRGELMVKFIEMLNKLKPKVFMIENVKGKRYYTGGGKRGILQRLSMEKPSLTLLCSPLQKQTERCHPLEERPLSIREYARIQSFDDDYNFYGSVVSQYKQIGNAVPVELAKYIGISLIETLKECK